MAAPSRETLQGIASETGHQPATLEKVLRLLDVLQEISADSLLRDRLTLKGGTALNIFHFNLDRLSVDILPGCKSASHSSPFARKSCAVVSCG